MGAGGSSAGPGAPPRTAVVIPHAGGEAILPACLASLEAAGLGARVWLVDNASPDGSVPAARERFPWLEVFAQERNLGFAGGCNAGLRAALADPTLEYALLLNNDVEVEAGWLEALEALADRHPRVAAAQPRLLSIPFPGKLDYSGAAGGLLDAYGYPYALGRVFGHCEEDGANWLEPRRLAWASGTACLLRLDALREVGLLDEAFFMHMEEIDLAWRLRLAGWEIASAPASRVRHHSGYSLGAESPRKVRLNHRNSLRMLLKNAGAGTLARRLPLRLLLELAAPLHYLAAGRPGHALAALKALAGLPFALPGLLSQRRGVQALRRVDEAEVQALHLPRCLPLAAPPGRPRTAGELGWLPPLLEPEQDEEGRP